VRPEARLTQYAPPSANGDLYNKYSPDSEYATFLCGTFTTKARKETIKKQLNGG